MKPLERVQRLVQKTWQQIHHARSLVALGWLGIVLGLLSLSRGQAALASIGIGLGVIAHALIAIYFVLVRLANSFDARTQGATVGPSVATQPAQTLQGRHTPNVN
jgi:threonine/homoserine efflux transporter RhtA